MAKERGKTENLFFFISSCQWNRAQPPRTVRLCNLKDLVCGLSELMFACCNVAVIQTLHVKTKRLGVLKIFPFLRKATSKLNKSVTFSFVDFHFRDNSTFLTGLKVFSFKIKEIFSLVQIQLL